MKKTQYVDETQLDKKSCIFQKSMFYYIESKDDEFYLNYLKDLYHCLSIPFTPIVLFLFHIDVVLLSKLKF